jgi:transposase
VASLYAKKVNGGTYYYLREMARVDGKPKRVSERYLGTAAEIEAAMDAREQALLPSRVRHLGFGDVAAVWHMLGELDVVRIVDEVAGPRRSDASASVGTYLALAVLGRVVAPCSKAAFADWWASTAGDRFTGISAAVLDHRRFWDAMRAVSLAELVEIERRITVGMIEKFALDVSALALDMTNFATYIDSGNNAAPIAQRGKAKQKRTDLRLVGLGLVVTRDGGIPLLSHAYPGNRPDVTQFATMIAELCARHAALAADAGEIGDICVVFDAGQNSCANFEFLHTAHLGFVGSIPPSDCPDLLAVPKRARRVVDAERFGGLTAFGRRRVVYGRERRVVLTWSPTLHAAQARGFDQTLAKAGAALDELAAVLARGKARRSREQVTAAITAICHNPWTARVLAVELTGDTPASMRLTWRVDSRARTRLENEVFGKRILVTDRDQWPIADVVAAYRSQAEAEFSFRQLKDPHVVSFAPMHHWTDHNIRVHVFTCVLGLTVAHLMRRQAELAGQHMSAHELLKQLSDIEETVMIYPSTGGRPKARRILTETSTIQDRLAAIFHLDRYAPTT